jgi:hypothetical protein
MVFPASSGLATTYVQGIGGFAGPSPNRDADDPVVGTVAVFLYRLNGDWNQGDDQKVWQGFQRWNEVPESPTQFVRVEHCYDAQLVVTDWPPPDSGNALADTSKFYPWSLCNSRVFDYLIRLSSWGNMTTPATIHEIGHIQGLGHTNGNQTCVGEQPNMGQNLTLPDDDSDLYVYEDARQGVSIRRSGNAVANPGFEEDYGSIPCSSPSDVPSNGRSAYFRVTRQTGSYYSRYCFANPIIGGSGCSSYYGNTTGDNWTSLSQEFFFIPKEAGDGVDLNLYLKPTVRVYSPSGADLKLCLKELDATSNYQIPWCTNFGTAVAGYNQDLAAPDSLLTGRRYNAAGQPQLFEMWLMVRHGYVYTDDWRLKDPTDTNGQVHSASAAQTPAWQAFGVAPASGDTAIASWAAGRIDAFYVKTDGTVMTKWGNGGILQGPASVGSPPGGASGISAVSWGGNRIDLFARGVNDGALWHRAYSNGWYPWESLGGVLALGSKTAVSSWSSNRLDIFVTGADNYMYQKYWSGTSFSGFIQFSTPAGGIFGLSAASWGSGRIDVFGRGSDNVLYQRYYGTGGWSGWSSHGGSITGNTAVASWMSYRLDVFVVDSGSGSLLRRSFDGTGWQPFSVQDAVAGGVTGPSAVDWGHYQVDYLVRKSDGDIWYRGI